MSAPGTLRIACIGWGSLLWDPRTLPRAGDFAQDGPVLPIEFSRVAVDGRVTLVVDPASDPVPTYSVPLSVGDLDEAVEALALREKVGPARRDAWIALEVKGRAEAARGEVPSPVRSHVAAWLADSAYDAVVWTALPSRTPAGGFARPSVEVLLAHVATLEGPALARAEEYVRRAPSAVRTAYRARFESELGWTPEER